MLSMTLDVHKENYPNPEQFDGCRFSRMREAEEEKVKYQTVALGLDYVTFGNGRHAWSLDFPSVSLRWINPCFLQPWSILRCRWTQDDACSRITNVRREIGTRGRTSRRPLVHVYRDAESNCWAHVQKAIFLTSYLFGPRWELWKNCVGYSIQKSTYISWYKLKARVWGERPGRYRCGLELRVLSLRRIRSYNPGLAEDLTVSMWHLGRWLSIDRLSRQM